MDEKVIEKNNKNNFPKWKKIIKKILNVVFIVLLVLLLILVVSGFIDKISQYNSSLFGYRFSVISSQSMSFVNDSNKERLKDYHDQYAKGTIIVANNYKSYDDVNINDVILYYNGSLLVCHRVVEKKEENLDAEIEKMIEERQAARKARDFKRADEIRDELLAQGIILEDTREGVKWKRA